MGLWNHGIIGRVWNQQGGKESAAIAEKIFGKHIVIIIYIYKNE